MGNESYIETQEIVTTLRIQEGLRITKANQEGRETKLVIEENPTDFLELETKEGFTKNSNGLQFQGVTLKEEVEPEKRTLKAHQEDLEPHICNLCDKTFSNQANLKNHLKSHDKYKQ